MTRAARQEDLPRILEIYNAAIADGKSACDERSRTLADKEVWFAEHYPKYPVIVSETDDRISGWAALSPWARHDGYAKTVEISLYVDADFRERGLGKQLLEALVAAGQQAGFYVFVARILEGNDVSVRLHERCGFLHVGRQPQAMWLNGEWLDVILMQRNT